MRSWVLLLSLVLASSAFGQARRTGSEQTIARHADPGVSRRVYTYVSFDSDCNPRPAPAIVIRVPPAHGRVETRPGNVTVGEVREGAPDCSGKILPGVSVLYTSAPDFHGQDRFEYDILSERSSTRHDTAVITVR